MQTAKKSVKSSDKKFYPEKMKRVRIFKNEFHEGDTIQEVHELLAEKLIKSKKAEEVDEETPLGVEVSTEEGDKGQEKTGGLEL